MRSSDLLRMMLLGSLSSSVSVKKSDGLGGEKVAWGVNFTAEKTSQIVAEQAGKHRSSVQPNEEPMYINPAVATSVHYVHRGSKIVAKCTRYLCELCFITKTDIHLCILCKFC